MLVWTVLTEEAVDSSRLRCDEESGHLEGVRRPMGVYALHRRPRFMLQLEAGRDDPLAVPRVHTPVCCPLLLHTVDAAIELPSPTSSPWMRRSPHLGFSRADRSTSARTGCATGGRPGCRRG